MIKKILENKDKNLKLTTLGFTLIELLAVIVILAIIALIATPIVLGIIEDSKDSAKLNSANHYIDAVEQAIMRYNMYNGGNFIPSECEIQNDGNLKCDGKDITVEVDGEKPTSGTITFVSGKIDDVGLNYEDKYIVDDENGTLIYGFKTYKNGEPVYYNVDTGKTCLESEAVSTTGTKSGCMKFYAFNDKGTNETVNLILDHNTTATVAWTNTDTTVNKNGPIDALTVLYNDTKDWVGTMSLEDYTMDQSTQISTANYTVRYSVAPEGETEVYKARLITAQEIAQIVKADILLNWDEKLETSGPYYFDGAKGTDATWKTPVANSTTPSDYGWLYDRTHVNCTEHGCLNDSDVDLFGYWTISSRATYTEHAWGIRGDGLIGNGTVVNNETRGVRPVIEVLKSNLS